MVDSRLAEMEEKYDLQPEALTEGFSEEGEDAEGGSEEEEEAATDDGKDGNDGF